MRLRKEGMRLRLSANRKKVLKIRFGLKMRKKDNKMQVWAHYCEMERSLNNHHGTTQEMKEEDEDTPNVSEEVVNKTMMYDELPQSK